MINTNWDNSQIQYYQDTIRRKIPGYDLIYEQMLAIIETNFIPQDILIVGAGGGQELYVLGKKYPETAYTALDPSCRMLELAKQRVDNMLLKVDWQETTLDKFHCEKEYDIVTCHLMLHFLKEEKAAILNQISQRVKAGGLLFISAIVEEEKKDSTLPFWLQHMRLCNVPAPDWEHFATSFDKTTHPLSASLLYQVLKDNGFEVILPYFKSYAIEAYVAIKGRGA
ncbi:class I SAM-dependent methyltransferase [Oceanobacillus jeddahense]|uniref:Class I SAM-dependent methyltransferase n=1 Tax=Oceanobacillus jeddahense TaxID=1462527 RepID=A0ABY5JLR0_9BACI|nr:class I SAM-dependent methyltransferase [Oceanobacillus jeddahense]UUI01066.1 class I SAM-dependent methyltransferase [Oceanobacillus jeddahense]